MVFCFRDPRGFGFIQYFDPEDAADAKYHMDRQFFLGREITVVFAEENRKKPSEMRAREGVRYTSHSHLILELCLCSHSCRFCSNLSWHSRWRKLIYLYTFVVAEAVLMIGDRAQGHLGVPTLQGVDHGPTAGATHRRLKEKIIPGIVCSYGD